MCELITPGDVTNYDKIQVYASGFCPVALVSGQGFILPGDNSTVSAVQIAAFVPTYLYYFISFARTDLKIKNFFQNGPNPASFVYFRSFHMTNIAQI